MKTPNQEQLNDVCDQITDMLEGHFEHPRERAADLTQALMGCDDPWDVLHTVSRFTNSKVLVASGLQIARLWSRAAGWERL